MVNGGQIQQLAGGCSGGSPAGKLDLGRGKGKPKGNKNHSGVGQGQKGREAREHGRHLGCLNVRGWGVGKLEDMTKELREWDLHVVGVTETQLRERLEVRSGDYNFRAKGRSKNPRKGGGVGLFIKRNSGLTFEELDVGNSEASEDILAVRIGYRDKARMEHLITVVCYMTVEGTGARVENERKYERVGRVIAENRQEQVIVMGDMNGHISILGEEINRNGTLLLEFVEEYDSEILNLTIAEGRVTWAERGRESAIDYILVNEKARRMVRDMWIDEEGLIDIVSDHNMMVLNCVSQGQREEGGNRTAAGT